MLRQRSKFEQELYAYRTWLPQLEPRVPQLLAADETKRVLLISALPGESLEAVPLSEAQRLNAYAQAGAFLRLLHGLPFTDDAPLSLSEAVLLRAKSWVARASGIVGEELRAWVIARVSEAAEDFETHRIRRVPCHRDYSGRNWLVVRAGERVALSVIDFEHSRHDFWLSDMEKLYLDGWDEKLEAAFWQDYGKQPTAAERTLLDKLGALAALTTVVWAREHRDTAFEVKGWHRLHELRARLDGALS